MPIERDARRAMIKLLRDHLRRFALLEQPRGVTVPDVVNVDPSNVGQHHHSDELAKDVVWMQRLTDFRAEHKIVVFPLGMRRQPTLHALFSVRAECGCGSGKMHR